MRRIFVTSFCLIVSMSFLLGSLERYATVSAQRSDSTRFLVGILRTDGVIVPFALFRSGKWSQPWPKPKEPFETYGWPAGYHSMVDLKTPWFSREKTSLKKWYLPKSNGALGTLTTSKTVQVDNHCGKNWGLQSNFPKTPTETNHHVNVGVVLSTRLEANNMLELKSSSADANKIISFIRPIFNKLESWEIAKLDARGSKHVFPNEKVRGHTPLTLSSIFRSERRIDGRHLYHFEIRKEYAKPVSSHDYGCGEFWVLHGWILDDKRGTRKLIDRMFYQTNCDGKNSGDLLPYTILTVRNQKFVIVRDHGYEDESYKILELGNSKIRRLIETDGGGC